MGGGCRADKGIGKYEKNGDFERNHLEYQGAVKTIILKWILWTLYDDLYAGLKITSCGPLLTKK